MRDCAGGRRVPSAPSCASHPGPRSMMKYVTLLAALLFAGPALGQDNKADPAANYPATIIKIIVCVPAGGGVDTITRIVADRLRQRLGQPVVIENPGGAARQT